MRRKRQIGEWVGRKKAQKAQKMRRWVVAGAAADVLVSIVRFDPFPPFRRTLQDASLDASSHAAALRGAPSSIFNHGWTVWKPIPEHQ